MGLWTYAIALVVGAAIFDWGARWQIENAFAFGLQRQGGIPQRDALRIGLLAGVTVCLFALKFTGDAGLWAVAGIAFVILYFLRTCLSFRDAPDPKSPPPAA